MSDTEESTPAPSVATQEINPCWPVATPAFALNVQDGVCTAMRGTAVRELSRRSTNPGEPGWTIKSIRYQVTFPPVKNPVFPTITQSRHLEREGLGPVGLTPKIISLDAALGTCVVECDSWHDGQDVAFSVIGWLL